jgi:hypothetical protein
MARARTASCVRQLPALLLALVLLAALLPHAAHAALTSPADAATTGATSCSPLPSGVCCARKMALSLCNAVTSPTEFGAGKACVDADMQSYFFSASTISYDTTACPTGDFMAVSCAPGVTSKYLGFTCAEWLTAGDTATLTSPYVSTLAGTGTAGNFDYFGVGAQLTSPTGITVGPDGNIYVSQVSGSGDLIRRVTPRGAVTTFVRSTAGLSSPPNIAFDSAGNLIIADPGNLALKKVDAATGAVTTLTSTFGSGTALGAVAALALLPSGNMVFGENAVSALRYFNLAMPAGTATLLAGSTSTGSPQALDGTGTVGRFYGIRGIAVDNSTSEAYVADKASRIRKVTPAGVVTTFAGPSPSGIATGSADGTGNLSTFNIPMGITWDRSGNLLVADVGNARIRKLTVPGAVATTLAGSTTGASTDGIGTAARFTNPSGIATDQSSGIVYIADTGNHKIRKLVLLSCSAGSYLSGTACYMCAAGSYQPAGYNTDSCAPCPAGYACASTNMTTPVACTGGKFSTAGATACTDCAAGSFSGNAADACTPCPPGTYAGTAAATACTNCAAGTYRATAGASGASDCLACGSGLTSAAGAAGQCTAIAPVALASALVTLLAGSYTLGTADGVGSNAAFNYPSSVAVNSAGVVFVADQYNHGTTSTASGGGEPPILRWFWRWFPRWFLRNRGGS